MFGCDPQWIPELKLQVSELQRQKQELEDHVIEQSKELEGDFFMSTDLTLVIFGDDFV